VNLQQSALADASLLFEVAGASSASSAKNLDRHWRNIRTISLHNPLVYKADAIGDYLVNGTPLPKSPYF